MSCFVVIFDKTYQHINFMKLNMSWTLDPGNEQLETGAKILVKFIFNISVFLFDKISSTRWPGAVPQPFRLD